MDQDDGRTIADMSQISRPSILENLSSFRRKGDQPQDFRQAPSPYPDAPFTAGEKRLFVFAALKAALLIALVFLVGLGLVIAALLAFWNLF